MRLGVGSISHHGKDCFQLRVGKRHNLIRIGKKLACHCIVKLEKIQDMLEFYSTHEWHPDYKMKNATKERLVDLYLNQRFSTRRLAEVYGVHPISIRRKLAKFDIPLNRSAMQLAFHEVD